MPGWDLAASVYATEVQPDFDADWLEGEEATVAARRPALAFEKQTTTSPWMLVASMPAELPPGGPTFAGGDPVAPPVVPPKGTPDTGLPPGVRDPLWTPADSPLPTRADAVIPWRKLAVFLVLIVLAAGAYKAYPRAHAWYLARGVPADLRAYVGGEGVRYAPAGQGYSVRLPKRPVRRDETLSAADPTRPWLTMHRSIVSSRDYQIVIRVADLPSGVVLPFGLVGALVDPRLAGTEMPANVHTVEFGGKPAYDYDFGADPPRRGRILRRGTRVYVLTVQSKGAGPVFDELVESFKPAA